MIGDDFGGVVVTLGEGGVDRVDVGREPGDQGCHGLGGVGALRLGERLAQLAHPTGTLFQLGQGGHQVGCGFVQGQSPRIAYWQSYMVPGGACGADIAAPQRDVHAQADSLIAGGQPAQAEGRTAAENATSLQRKVQLQEHVPEVVGGGVVDPKAEMEAGDLPECTTATIEPLPSGAEVAFDPDGGDAHHGAAQVLTHAQVEESRQLAVNLGPVPLHLEPGPPFVHRGHSQGVRCASRLGWLVALGEGAANDQQAGEQKRRLETSEPGFPEHGLRLSHPSGFRAQGVRRSPHRQLSKD